MWLQILKLEQTFLPQVCLMAHKVPIFSLSSQLIFNPVWNLCSSHKCACCEHKTMYTLPLTQCMISLITSYMHPTTFDTSLVFIHFINRFSLTSCKTFRDMLFLAYKSVILVKLYLYWLRHYLYTGTTF